MELILALAPVLFFLYSAYDAYKVEKKGKACTLRALPKGWIKVGLSEITVENDTLDKLDFLTEPKLDLIKLRSRLQYKYSYTRKM